MKEVINPNDYLSDKAKLVVQELAVSEFPTTFSTDNEEPAVYHPKTNTIELNLKKIDNFDYYFLHEFYHAFQGQDGYPFLVAGETNKEYHFVASLLNSFVRDFNVEYFLNKYDYAISYKSKQKAYTRRLKYLNDSIQRKDYIDQMQIIIFISTSIAYLYIGYDKVKSEELIELSKQCSDYIWRFTKSLIKIIELGDYTSKKGCELIYKSILKGILKEYNLSQFFVLRVAK